MAEPTRDEFLRSLGVATDTAAPTPAAPEPISLLPATADALNKQTEKLQQGQLDVSTQTSPDFAAKLGARPGVPFDADSGIPFMQRLRASAQPTPEEEVKALEAAYGKGNVRKNSYGWLVVTKPGDDGKVKDVLVDPVGVDMGDLASVAAQAPEFIGGILASAATGGASRLPGILNAAKTLIAMVGGAAAGGAAKDVLVRSAEGQPIQPGEIGTRRGEQAVVDAATGTALGVGAKIAGTLFSPFSASGPVQFNAKKAQTYFATKYGIKLAMTPAESTGNSFLQRAEAMEMQKPGASVPFEKLLKTREQQINDLQKVALGGAVPDEEAAAQRAIDALGAKVAPLEKNVQRDAAATASAAEGELVSSIGPAVDKTALGATIRTKAETLRSNFQNASNTLYDDVFSDPLTQTKNIPGAALAKDAQSIVDKLPTVSNRTSSIGYDAYGNPIEVTSNKPEVLKEFVPDGVLSKLQALGKSNGQDFRLDELMSMRREVANDIAQGESIPGVQTRYLKQIQTFLTDRIKTGLNELSPDLLAKWEKANAFYADNVGKFKKAGISELFKDPEQAGYLGDTSIVDRVTNGGVKAQDTYTAYKEFFGPTSNEVNGLKQAIRDDIFGRDTIEGLIDAKGFVQRITQLGKDAPAALQDAFGSSAAKLVNSARALSVAKGATLPADELMRAVNSGNLSATKLSDMLSSQAIKDQAYRNNLVKAVADNSIKPTEFVDRAVFKAEPKDLSEAMSLLGGRPDVTEDIRRLTFQRVLDEATTVARGTGNKVLVANDLEKTLSDPLMAKRLRTVLGASTFDDLTQLAAFLKPGAVVQQAAKSAGGIGAGQQVAGLVERGALKYVYAAARNFFISTVYTHPAMRAMLTNTALSEQGKAALVNYTIASTPFLEAAVKTYGKEKARQVVAALKNGVDQSIRDNPNEATVEPTREEFMKSLGR